MNPIPSHHPSLPILGILPSELPNLFDFQPSFRLKQVTDWVWHKFQTDFQLMSNLPPSLRESLSQKFSPMTMSLARETSSPKTGTLKFGIKTGDGRLIEAVLIPDAALSEGDSGRYTLCLSSQVGCSFACAFCATGTMGLRRNLEAHEIVEQFVLLQAKTGGMIRNIVFMGMGEPLANRPAVFRALKIMTEPEALGLSPTRLTISTSGVISGIEQLAAEHPKVRLMISLHAAIQSTRDHIMPNLVGQSLRDLHRVLVDYHGRGDREIGLEYIMLRGVNDRSEDLGALIDFARPLHAKINLIAYNRNPGLPFEPSDSQTIQEFQNGILRAGLVAIQRYKKGDDIAAACGQLATEG